MEGGPGCGTEPWLWDWALAVGVGPGMGMNPDYGVFLDCGGEP